MWSKEILDEVFSSDWVSRLTIDELLSIFWLPSRVRSRALEIERAMRDLDARWGRLATRDEIATELTITGGDVGDSISRIGRSKNDPLDALRGVLDSYGDEVSLHDTLPGSHGPEPRARVDEGEVRSRVADAIAAMPGQERYLDLFTLCHSLHLTLYEIGNVIHVGDQTVVGGYARAVLRLRSRLPDVVRLAEGPKRGSASRGPLAFRQARAWDRFWHVLVGEPPYQFTLCGQRYALPVTHSHEIRKWRERSPLCPECKVIGDWGRPYGRPEPGGL